MTTRPTPVLMGLEPRSIAGWRVSLSEAELVVGAGPECDIRLRDPHVSRRHASLTTRQGWVWVADLGSTGGTAVNGQPVRAPHALRPGDVVTFASVSMRFESGAPAPAKYYIDRQQAAGSINNVAGDQHSYVAHQRDSLLRDIAATRTKGRWLVALGALVTLVGFSTFAAGALGFMTKVLDGISSGSTRPPHDPSGWDVAGIPSGLLGWAIAVGGMVLLVLGIVLHVVAIARRRRLERDLPLPLQPRYLRGV